MSLQSQISTLATRIGTEFKTRQATIGANADLATTSKSTLVAAINEVLGVAQGGGGGGAVIDDDTTGTVTVWSSQKTSDSIAAAVTALIDGAPGALDTLKELADALANDEDAISALTTAIAGAVRFDQAQSLTTPQKAQAVGNIGAISAADIGDPETDFVAVFNAALV